MDGYPTDTVSRNGNEQVMEKYIRGQENTYKHVTYRNPMFTDKSRNLMATSPS